jgi:hypothetical protein
LTIRTMAWRNGDRIGPRKWSTGGQKSAELPRKEAVSKTTRRTLGVHAPPRFLDPLPKGIPSRVRTRGAFTRVGGQRLH